MNKKDLNLLMKKIDKTPFPKHWRKFVNKQVKNHNIFLRYGSRCYCTHCKKYSNYDSNQQNYRLKKCDFCGNTLHIANHNIKKYKRLKDIAFYVKVDNMLVLRIFEIESIYDYKTRTFKKDLKEYARFIPNIGIIINNTVSFAMWNMVVYHDVKINNWHIYTGTKKIDEMPIYPYNKKHLYKGTPYEYAPITEFKKEYKHFNDYQILEIAGYSSFELLWKMGLKKLSLDAKKFNKKGNFKKRFGLDKSYLKFMIDNNISYREYELLKVLERKDMYLIDQYSRYNIDYLKFMKKQNYLYDREIVEKYRFDYDILKYICKYMPLRKFLNYKKGVEKLYIYKDYLKMLEELGYKMKCKDELFPKQLVARHDKLMKNIEVKNDTETAMKFGLRFLDLSKYIYSDDKYIIFPAPSIEALIDEGLQQRNCVGYRYNKPYMNGQTEIYFIRQLDDINTSFITLEYYDNRVVQKELAHHGIDFTNEQLEFIDKWIGHRSFIDQKEEIKNKSKNKAAHYNTNKMAA